MRAAREVPVVRDSGMFVAAEEARLEAMAEAQSAGGDEARLECTLLVTNLYQQQIDTLGDEVMSELAEADPGRDRELASEWIQDWLPAAESGMKQWAAFQEDLVARVGEDRAQALADGPVTARMEAVIDSARGLLLLQAERMGLDVDRLRRETEPPSEMKTCPDCAEDVKAAARKCRYCGYRFDEESEGATGA